MKPSIDNAKEPTKRDAQQQDAYRAPRLVTLGTTVGLVQGVTGAPAADYYGYIRQ